MQTRPARVEDRERLLALWERSVRATHGLLTEDDIVALRPLVVAELGSAAVDWWVLVSPAEVIPPPRPAFSTPRTPADS